MAAPQKGASQMADASGNPLIGNRSANIADVTATLATITAAAPTRVTITYTTDDPGTTANGAVTVADGDAALVVAEVNELFDEFEDSVADLVTLTTELRTDHAATIVDIAALIVAVNSILDVLEVNGFMIAT